MASFLAAVRSVVLLVARLGLGGILLWHGWIRWTGGAGPNQGVQKQIDYLTQFGVPSPNIAAWALIGVELVGGMFLIVGALTPVIGFLIAIEQGLLIAYTTWYKHWNLLNADGTYNGGYEYMVALGLLGLIFGVYGAGKVSIDALFGREKDEDVEVAPKSATRPTGTTGSGQTGTTRPLYGAPRSPAAGVPADTPTVQRPRVTV